MKVKAQVDALHFLLNGDLPMRNKKRNSQALALFLSILLSLAQFSCSNSGADQNGTTQPGDGHSTPRASTGAFTPVHTWDKQPIQDAEFLNFKKILEEVTSGVGKIG